MDPSRLFPALGTSGAPPALPAALDRASEGWWALSPRLRAAIVMVLLVAGLAVLGRGATRSPWGPPVAVVVAAADLSPGAPIGPGDLRTASWPADLVPANALVDPTDLGTDARVRGPIPAGTALTPQHLVTGVSGLVEPGEAAVPLPTDRVAGIQAGEVVDVVATSVHGTGQRVADGARVVAVDADWIWLAVRLDQVEAVAAAGTTGQALLAVRPGR